MTDEIDLFRDLISLNILGIIKKMGGYFQNLSNKLIVMLSLMKHDFRSLRSELCFEENHSENNDYNEKAHIRSALVFNELGCRCGKFGKN